MQWNCGITKNSYFGWLNFFCVHLVLYLYQCHSQSAYAWRVHYRTYFISIKIFKQASNVDIPLHANVHSFSGSLLFVILPKQHCRMCIIVSEVSCITVGYGKFEFWWGRLRTREIERKKKGRGKKCSIVWYNQYSGSRTLENKRK